MSTPYRSARQQEIMKVSEQAAEWMVAVEEGDKSEFPALAEWLKESPLHVEMLLRMAAVDRLMDFVPIDQRRQVHAAIEADAGATVTHLTPALSALEGRRGGKKSGWTGWVTGIAAALTAGVGTLWWLGIVDLGGSQRITTSVGEQRSISLPDGSVVHLNADSRVEVRYSAQERSLLLLSGEALFKVQHDAARPFRVQVDEVVVQALGTQFNIYRRHAQTSVAVIEGMVQIAPSATTATVSKPERLTAGEGIILTAHAAIQKREAIDPAQVTAWRQRRLIFRWASLGTIVEEFNRYNSSPQIRIESDALRERRYTAVFDADAPRELLKFLERDDGVRVTTAGNELVIQARDRWP